VQEPKSFVRRDRLVDIETGVQSQWEAAHVFELDAPAVGSADANQPKFLATFPYPYMNGSFLAFQHWIFCSRLVQLFFMFRSFALGPRVHRVQG
jgi:hypothetical protein